MIIISDKPGQLGNLLIIYANFLAYGKEYGIRICNPAFFEYISYFKQTEKRSARIQHVLYRCVNLLARIFSRLGFKNSRAINWHERIVLDDLNQFNTGKRFFYFVRGWQYRSGTLIQKHRDEIVKYFRLAEAYQQKLDLFFRDKFNDGKEIVIGVHIRRGDYKKFESGKYYYSFQDYTVQMRKVQMLFPQQVVSFLVCSNEKFGPEILEIPGLKIIQGPGHELLDMYSLTRCNYILGVPSTYSMWASFYGEVPIYFINDPDAEFTLDDFKVKYTGSMYSA